MNLIKKDYQIPITDEEKSYSYIYFGGDFSDVFDIFIIYQTGIEIDINAEYIFNLEIKE